MENTSFNSVQSWLKHESTKGEQGSHTPGLLKLWVGPAQIFPCFTSARGRVNVTWGYTNQELAFSLLICFMNGGRSSSFLFLASFYIFPQTWLWNIVNVLIPICSRAPMRGQKRAGTDSPDIPAGWTVLTQHRKTLLPPETKQRFREQVTHVCPWWKFSSSTLEHVLVSCGSQIFPNHHLIYLPSSLALQDPGWMFSGSDTYLNQGIIAQHFSWRATGVLTCYLMALRCVRSSWSGAGFCAISGILNLNTRLRLLGQECMFLNILCPLDLRLRSV